MSERASPVNPRIKGELVSSQILEELAGTPYACSSLEQLAGGTANYTFKGTLTTPLVDGTSEIAIKNSKPYSASSNSFPLDISRSFAEEESLKATATLPPAVSERVVVRTPKLYHYSRDTNTQIQEYLGNAIDLKNYGLTRLPGDQQGSKAQILAVGEGIGRWLRNFHTWAAQPEQAHLREQAKANQSMQGLKFRFNYLLVTRAVNKYADSLGGSAEVLKQVEAMAEAELEDESKLHVIHGDFWTGNALVPNVSFKEGEQTTAFIVDWEMCQLGVRPLDLGQMIAEIYNLFLFKGIEAGKWLVEGFAEGYGYVDDDFAFRVAIHAGVHLVGITHTVPGWGDEAQVQKVAEIGAELIVRAWHKDRSWFEASDLACLFRKTESA